MIAAQMNVAQLTQIATSTNNSIAFDAFPLQGELIVLTFSLWLLLRVSAASNYDRTPMESEA